MTIRKRSDSLGAKEKTTAGCARLAKTYELRRNGEQVAICQELREGGWFWYGNKQNTCRTPVDLETVKKECLAYFKELEKNYEN